MQKKVRYIIMTLLFVIGLVSIENTVEANDEGLGFSVNHLPSSKQIDPESGFYYLKTEPGIPQTVEVVVASTKKEPVEVRIEALNAFSGSNGSMYYNVSDEKDDKLTVDPTLKYPFETLVTGPESVTVENFEKKTVEITLTPPKENYDGVIMGALFFSIGGGVEGSPVGVSQGYEIGTVLSESGEEFTNGTKLNLISVKPGLVRSQRMVLANIQNPDSKVLQNVDMVATIKEKKSGKIIKENDYKGYSLAPNSNTNLEFQWGLAQLPTGSFTFELKGHNDFEEWFFTEDFNISSKEANEINSSSAFEIVTPRWIKLFAVANGIIVVIQISYLAIRRKSMEKAWRKEQIDRKKRRKRDRKKGRDRT